MLLGKRFAEFVAGSPISVMMRGIIENAFDPDRINAVFEQTAQVQYTRDLRFSTVAELMGKVVFDISPSIADAYQHAEQDIPVSRKSVYNKLNGVEPQVSAALVADSYHQFAAVIAELKPPTARLLPGYRVRIIDGNHFAATEHRLKPTRTRAAAPLPGKALVVLDADMKLATTVIPCEDGHAQERALFDQVVPLVSAGDLWIADRNFATVGLITAIQRRGGCLIIREHANLPGSLLGQRRHVGSTDTGEVYEQGLELVDPSDGATIRLRRISIELNKPTRDGDRELHVLSNLPTNIPATKICELYAKRWRIETMFQEMTTALTSEIKTLAYPKAAVFAFSLALIAYNAMSVIMAAISAAHQIEDINAKVSRYYLVGEIVKVTTGMMMVIPPKHWKVFQDLSATEMAAVLLEVASNANLKKYAKHPRGPKKPQPPRTIGKSPHVSTYRLLNEQKSRQ